MGKVNRGFNQVALNGSVGAVTYVTRKGVTIARQKVPAKSAARKTLRSQTQRMKWVNNVRLFQALNVVGWHPSFTNKTGLQSDYNMFVKVNSALDVYLPKFVVDGNGGVVVGATITNGTLPTVGGMFGEANEFVSNINMGGMTIGASTTIATFSRAIIDNNPDWAEGDQLTYVRLDQLQDAATGLPRIKADIRQVYLGPNDELTLLDDLASYFHVVNGKLAGDLSANSGIAFVHSRGEGADFAVSTEQLLVQNSLMSVYMGTAALNKAIASYGGLSVSQYLVPELSDNGDIYTEP
jgi:hypothetical protein